MAERDDQVVVLMSAANEAEAAIIIARLDAEGIQATTVGALTAGFRAEAPGFVQVLVPKADLDRAKQILADPDA